MKIFYDCGFHKGWVTDKFLSENEDAICFAFEPNDLLEPYYTKILDKYGDRIKFSNALVWDENTELDFWIGVRDMQGSSVISSKKRLTKKSVKKHAIDFSQFLLSSSNPDDYIVLKMDIEGAEYKVLRKMVDDGSIRRVNEITVEFHGGKLRNDEWQEDHQFLKDYFDSADWLKKTLWRL
jgi:FkbM family methyltransferase